MTVQMGREIETRGAMLVLLFCARIPETLLIGCFNTVYTFTVYDAIGRVAAGRILLSPYLIYLGVQIGNVYLGYDVISRINAPNCTH